MPYILTEGKILHMHKELMKEKQEYHPVDPLELQNLLIELEKELEYRKIKPGFTLPDEMPLS